MSISQRFPATLESLAEARQFVRDHWSQDNLDMVLIVIGELIQNVVRHGRPPASEALFFEMALDSDRQQISVTDNGLDWSPSQKSDTDITSGGHGLGLVETLSETFEIQRVNDENVMKLSFKKTAGPQ